MLKKQGDSFHFNHMLVGCDYEECTFKLKDCVFAVFKNDFSATAVSPNYCNFSKILIYDKSFNNAPVY